MTRCQCGHQKASHYDPGGACAMGGYADEARCKVEKDVGGGVLICQGFVPETPTGPEAPQCEAYRRLVSIKELTVPMDHDKDWPGFDNINRAADRALEAHTSDHALLARQARELEEVRGLLKTFIPSGRFAPGLFIMGKP